MLANDEPPVLRVLPSRPFICRGDGRTLASRRRVEATRREEGAA